MLHTGGTLGMKGAPLEPDQYADALTESVPELNEIADLDTEIICNLDSSDISSTHWSQLAQLIDQRRKRYDGFVIVHGTDTMAYTASALSFALEGLDRPVILTGAQRPLTALRTDARRNLTDAVTLATCDIPEIGICFDGLLLRGCRTTKGNVHDYRAFESPGCEPLAKLGVDVHPSADIRRPVMPFRCDPRFDERILIVHIFPGMKPELLRHLLTPTDEIQGVVLVAFGLGTIPTHTRDLAPALRALTDAKIPLLVITQSTGSVALGRYQNSLELLDMGAISGGAMQLEAATTKLMHALAISADLQQRRRYLEWNVAGEL